MSKTRRDNRSVERRFYDGPKKNNSANNKSEKRLKNLFRSNNVEDISHVEYDEWSSDFVSR